MTGLHQMTTSLYKGIRIKSRRGPTVANWEDSYSGELSFLRSGFADSAAGLDLAILGIPYDLGTTGRPGTRMGPRGLREQSVAVGEFIWGVWPWDYHLKERFKVGDLGDLGGFTAYPDRLCPIAEAKADEVLAAGSTLMSLGGDHFITLPLLRAHARKYGPLSLVHFDAHSDTWIDDDLNHGTMFWHALQEGIIDPARSIQVGLRTPNPDTHGIKIIDGNMLHDLHPHDVASQIKERVGDSAAYLTFDIDFLDPAHAPATGTPVSGGPDVTYARRTLQALEGINFVGGDLVEVAPPYEGPHQKTALAGATLAADILYLLAAARNA